MRAYKKKIQQPNPQMKHIMHELPHRVQARRIANGRGPIPQMHEIHQLTLEGSATADQWLQYEGLDTATAFLMSLVSGFVYTPGESSTCSDTIFVGISSWINSIDTVQKFYLPYEWPNFQANLQDILASQSAIIYDCEIDKLFTTLTHLPTTEGLSELGARLAGAAAFELYDVIKIVGKKDVSWNVKMKKIGRLAATTLNYHI